MKRTRPPRATPASRSRIADPSSAGLSGLAAARLSRIDWSMGTTGGGAVAGWAASAGGGGAAALVVGGVDSAAWAAALPGPVAGRAWAARSFPPWAAGGRAGAGGAEGGGAVGAGEGTSTQPADELGGGDWGAVCGGDC